MFGGLGRLYARLLPPIQHEGVGLAAIWIGAGLMVASAVLISWARRGTSRRDAEGGLHAYRRP
jgi:hypothetical protein